MHWLPSEGMQLKYEFRFLLQPPQHLHLIFLQKTINELWKFFKVFHSMKCMAVKEKAYLSLLKFHTETPSSLGSYACLTLSLCTSFGGDRAKHTFSQNTALICVIEHMGVCIITHIGIFAYSIQSLRSKSQWVCRGQYVLALGINGALGYLVMHWDLQHCNIEQYYIHVPSCTSLIYVPLFDH